MTWDQDQAWEASWWGDCTNTFWEEAKQITYAHRMGLAELVDNNHRHRPFDLGGRSVLDIGGGPTSMLLRCCNRGRCAVVDPLSVPGWVRSRYREAKITLIQETAETVLERGYDEVWIYNCLQHTLDPEAILVMASQAAPFVRLFEWIDTPISDGHPHSFTAEWLSLYVDGQTEFINENSCVGNAFYAAGVWVRTSPQPAETAAAST